MLESKKDWFLQDGKCVCLSCDERSDCKDLCQDLGRPKNDCDEASGRCICLNECKSDKDCKERCRNEGKLGTCKRGKCACIACDRPSDCKDHCYDLGRLKYDCEQESGRCKCLKECDRSRDCKERCLNEGKLGACKHGKCACIACDRPSDCKDYCYDLERPKYDCDGESGRCKCSKECNRNRDCKKRCRNKGKLDACVKGECICENCVRTSDCKKFCKDSGRPRYDCDEETGKCKCMRKLRVRHFN